MAGIDTVVESIGGHAQVGATAYPHVRGWSLSIKAEANKYASTDTAGWTGKMMGHKDWSGSITVYCDDTNEIQTVCTIGGATAQAVTLATGPGTHVQEFTGNAFITDVSIEIDIETGKPVAATISFEGHGALTPAF